MPRPPGPANCKKRSREGWKGWCAAGFARILLWRRVATINPESRQPVSVRPTVSVHPTQRASAWRRLVPASALAATVALSACAHVVQGDACPGTPGQEILERINRVREGAGLQPLVVDLRLVRAAQTHAESMRDEGFFGHVGPDGREPADRVAAHDYQWTFVAENLAAGSLTPTRVVAGWLESPLHRDNMLEPEAEQVGIALAGGGTGQYRQYWTAVFASTDAPAHTPEGGCHP